MDPDLHEWLRAWNEHRIGLLDAAEADRVMDVHAERAGRAVAAAGGSLDVDLPPVGGRYVGSVLVAEHEGLPFVRHLRGS